jgi:hypothetical protein
MNAKRFSLHSLLMLCLSLLAAGAFAQAQPAQGEFKPEVGQPGKDVVWVPTSQVLVDKMLDMAKVTPNDVVIDLGSGDGRTVVTAAKRGAEATGFEFNPNMVALSRKNAAEAGVSNKATFVNGDLFEADLSRATVITMFLLPDINLKLRPKILALKPGTRVVSNSFTMGEWTDDETASLEASAGCNYWCTAHLWIVPARVEGAWRLPQGELSLKQDFQMISGSLQSGGARTAVSGRLRGDQISFTAGGATYTGSVNGSLMQGTVKSAGKSDKWTAKR